MSAGTWSLKKRVAQVRDGTEGPMQANESALEERLRNALSGAAPEGYPTIGVRERVVGSVRARVRRRQRIAGGLAACCLVIGGVSAGVVSWRHTQSPGNESAAALPSNGRKAPASLSRPAQASIPAPHSNCGEVVEGSRVAAGCYGLYNGSPEFEANSPLYEYAAPGTKAGPLFPTPATTPSKATDTTQRTDAAKPLSGNTAPGGTSAGAASAREVSYRILVPLGQPVTVMLPGTTGKIWSAPAVAPGQGPDAAQVRVIREQSGGVGKGSSASFESDVAVTVLIDASAIDVCGDLHIPCGSPTSTWELVLEFQES
jgi:hypothetical protein